MEKKSSIERITRVAIVAALYAAITMISAPISYENIQFRISEFLVLLCFFNKDYILGVTLGCLLSNIISFSPWDLLFGTLATFLSSILIYFSPKLLIACFPPIVFNGFIVGAELYFIQKLPFWLTVGQVIAGETVVIFAGYIIWMLILRNKSLYRIFDINKHENFKW